ncbi:MAG: aminodeoxychorismate/anthranilate synthase component II [Legionella sp.]|nr:aminodeoxychorismate/anthranilate synthase component II [Legionella sp.]
MLLVIDNYDSFTYNLVQYFQCLNQKVVVFSNDAISINDIPKLAPTHLVISPGPNAPEDAGISLEVIKHYGQTLPILGICLGHQCLAHAFGAKIITAPEIIHGKTSAIHHNSHGLFRGLPTPFKAMRYHSLAVDQTSLPDCLTVDAWTDDTIMAISHRQYPLFGLQFHPESILSEHGLHLLAQFIHHEY